MPIHYPRCQCAEIRVVYGFERPLEPMAPWLVEFARIQLSGIYDEVNKSRRRIALIEQCNRCGQNSLPPLHLIENVSAAESR